MQLILKLASYIHEIEFRSAARTVNNHEEAYTNTVGGAPGANDISTRASFQ